MNTEQAHLATISADGKWLYTGAGLRNIYIWDMDWAELAIATVEQAEQRCLAVHGDLIALGDQSGAVTFSRAKNLVLQSPLVTARRDGPVPCPHCHGDLTAPRPAVAAIEWIELNALPQRELSPCLTLPESAWNIPELSTTCECCRKKVRFNPFFVGSAKANVF
jgi:hypothetical protein